MIIVRRRILEKTYSPTSNPGAASIVESTVEWRASRYWGKHYVRILKQLAGNGDVDFIGVCDQDPKTQVPTRNPISVTEQAAELVTWLVKANRDHLAIVWQIFKVLTIGQ